MLSAERRFWRELRRSKQLRAKLPQQRRCRSEFNFGNLSRQTASESGLIVFRACQNAPSLLGEANKD